MGKCKHYGVCGLEDADQPDNYLCILHSTDPNKDKKAFEDALTAHRLRDEQKHNFADIVFPDEINFAATTFTERANFTRAKFIKEANFDGAVFEKSVTFIRSEFAEHSSFAGARFLETVWFSGAVFSGDSDFYEANFSRIYLHGTEFMGRANFALATFSEPIRLRGTRFKGGADFSDVSFNRFIYVSDIIFSDSTLFSRATFAEQVVFNIVTFKKKADFSGAVFAKGGEFLEANFNGLAGFTQARFLGPTSFTGLKTKVFGEDVLFDRTVIDRAESLRFTGVDLSRCKFFDTDVRKIRFIDVRWAPIGGRDGVYDEVMIRLQPGEQRQWAQIEELYRQLKQNYEDRRDYERAGDFHVGEKEMRLRNPETPSNLRILLAIYKGISGYGENYGRPLFWLILLLLLTSATALVHGLSMETGNQVVLLSRKSWFHWGWAFLYGLETLVHLPAREFTASGFGRVVSSLAGVFGPVLIALFGFALRQRLKR